MGEVCPTRETRQPEEDGHPFPNMCMFCLTHEINFHGNILYEGNGCFGQPPSVALSSRIQLRHRPEQLQKDANNMEKPGHSTVSVQVEWVNTFHNRFHRVKYLERIHQNTGDEVPWEVRRSL